MAVYGLVGVLGILMIHMVLACRKILVGNDLFFPTFYMILGMGLG